MITKARAYKTEAQLNTTIDYITKSPKEKGILKMIVARPAIDQRKILTDGLISKAEGLVGDNWKIKKSFSPPGPPHPEKQITLMNARCIEMLATQEDEWPLAGDQLFVDFDLSESNLKPGDILKIGSTVELKVSALPHNGCKKFAERFGTDAVKFVNSKHGKSLHFRGINASVTQEGTIKKGDIISKK